MSNSELVTYTRILKNCHKMVNKQNKKITIHHMAGNLSLKQVGDVFVNRESSANYAIDSKGNIGLYVNECDRAWTSASWDNDSQAVTIEVANNKLDPEWTISDKAMKALINLCVDICQRNNIKELVFTGDKNGTLTYHYMFANTACPGPYIKSKTTYICECVNALLKGQDVQVKSPIKSTKTNEKIAVEVIRGLWGVYPERKKLLEEAGYNYSEVQKIVNQLMNGKYNVYFD